jgi:hypothetical protein
MDAEPPDLQELPRLPREQWPQPTMTVTKKGEYTTIKDRTRGKSGKRGQIAGALYACRPGGQPPEGFVHVWRAPKEAADKRKHGCCVAADESNERPGSVIKFGYPDHTEKLKSELKPARKAAIIGKERHREVRTLDRAGGKMAGLGRHTSMRGVLDVYKQKGTSGKRKQQQRQQDDMASLLARARRGAFRRFEGAALLHRTHSHTPSPWAHRVGVAWNPTPRGMSFSDM